jgi:hypothetical protein
MKAKTRKRLWIAAAIVGAFLIGKVHAHAHDTAACARMEAYEHGVKNYLDAFYSFSALAKGSIDSNGAPMTEVRRTQLAQSSQQMLKNADQLQRNVEQEATQCSGIKFDPSARPSHDGKDSE